jgi:hypothetical protein
MTLCEDLRRVALSSLNEPAINKREDAVGDFGEIRAHHPEEADLACWLDADRRYVRIGVLSVIKRPSIVVDLICGSVLIARFGIVSCVRSCWLGWCPRRAESFPPASRKHLLL